MEKNISLLEDTLHGEGLIPEIFSEKVFTNNFLVNLQKSTPENCWKQIKSKMASIISKTLKDKSLEEGIEALRKLVSSEHISWDITSIPHESEYMAKEFAKAKGLELEKMFELKYEAAPDNVFTAITPKSNKQKAGRYKLLRTGDAFSFEDIGLFLGHILLFNGLSEFISKNVERCEYVFLKTLSYLSNVKGKELRGSEDIIDYISSLNKKFKDYIVPVEIVSMEAKKTCFYIEVADIFLDNFGIHANDFRDQRVASRKLRVVFLGNLLLNMNQLSESVISFVSNAQEAEQTYAKSYELKKNIPDATIAKMKSTCLNNLFSEVEIDEKMDLAKFEEVEKEYSKYSHMFPTVKSPSLRFRRLGKYKAGGIYFAYQKAVCVDIYHTKSMIHELSHWLDYNYRFLLDSKCSTFGYSSLLSSNDMEFWQIAQKYISALDDYVERLPEDDPLKETYCSNKKYSRRYYADNTEIFARLSEMYFEHNFGKSILWKTEGFAYPKNDELLAMTIKFFDRIFAQIKLVAPTAKIIEETSVMHPTKVASAKESSTPKKDLLTYEYSLAGNQFSLF